MPMVLHAGFRGALGQAVSQLGLPRTEERFLASSLNGRYQVYSHGIAVWEDNPDIGFPVSALPIEIIREGRKCRAIVGFLDLRNFTSWSKDQEPKSIQNIVGMLEEEFQAAFSKAWCHRLFTKGTGDGFMIVSEESSTHERPNSHDYVPVGHAAAFAIACSTLVEQVKPQLPADLAIGCGITIGEVTQVFLLGRPDYIGEVVNEAAKIQQLCWNELCVTEAFLDAMRADGMKLAPHRLSGKGWRLRPQDCVAAAEQSG